MLENYSLIYVATTGNDTTGDGTFTLPYLTVSKAATETGTNVLIILKDGTYAGDSNCIVENSTDIVGVIAENPGKAILDGAVATNPHWNLAPDNTHSEQNMIKGIEFKNFSGNAVVLKLLGSNDGWEISECIVNNCENTVSGLFDIKEAKFTNCLIYENTVIDTLIESVTSLEFNHSTVVDNIMSPAVSIFTFDSDMILSCEIRNSIFYGNTDNTILSESHSDKERASVHHCLIGQTAGGSSVVDLIDVWDILNISLPQRRELIDNISPSFVDASADNYRLDVDSICIIRDEYDNAMGCYQRQGELREDEPSYGASLNTFILSDTFKYMDINMRGGNGGFVGGGNYSLISFSKSLSKEQDLDYPGYSVVDDDIVENLYDYKVFIQPTSNAVIGDYWVVKVNDYSFKVYNSGNAGTFVWTIGG